MCDLKKCEHQSYLGSVAIFVLLDKRSSNLSSKIFSWWIVSSGQYAKSGKKLDLFFTLGKRENCLFTVFRDFADLLVHEKLGHGNLVLALVLAT